MATEASFHVREAMALRCQFGNLRESGAGAEAYDSIGVAIRAESFGSNENKMSCRERERAPLQVEGLNSCETEYYGGSRSAPSLG
jgi:hypothetical protein